MPDDCGCPSRCDGVHYVPPPTPDVPVPAAAAAAQAGLSAMWKHSRTSEDHDDFIAECCVTAALAAAGPFIAADARAAERKRILNDDRESDPAASVYRLGHQHGRDAERKRIRQLAIKHKASYYVGAKHDVTFSGLFREFADLLDGTP